MAALLRGARRARCALPPVQLPPLRAQQSRCAAHTAAAACALAAARGAAAAPPSVASAALAELLRASRLAAVALAPHHGAGGGALPRAAALALAAGVAARPREARAEAGGGASGRPGALASERAPLPHAHEPLPPPQPRLALAPALLKWFKLVALGGVVYLLECWHPRAGVAVGLLIAAATRPAPDSLWDFLESRRMAGLRDEPSAAKRLLRSVDPTSALAAVQVMDCGAFLVGEVSFVNERTTLIGALGEWYIVAEATQSWALPVRRAAEAGREWAEEARRAAADARRDAEKRAAAALAWAQRFAKGEETL